MQKSVCHFGGRLEVRSGDVFCVLHEVENGHL